MRGRPIALQILLVTIVTAVVLGIVLVIVVKQIESATLRAQLRTSSASTVAAVAAAAANAIVSEDGPVLQMVAEDVIKAQPSIHEIVIMNEAGLVLAESQAEDSEMQEPALVFTDSVVHMGEHFGSIRIAWNIDQAMDEIAQYAWRASLISAIGVLCVAVIILVLVRGMVVKPLQLVAKRVQAIQEGRDPPKFVGDPAVELVVLNNAVDGLADSFTALQVAEKQYRQLFDNDITGNFISTPTGEIIDCNAAFIRMYGFASVQDARSRGELELWGSSKDRDEIIEALRNHGRLYHQEIRVKRVDGSTLHGVQNLVGIFNDERDLFQVQGYVMDVTEHRDVEVQLRQAERMNALGRLAGGIAHDFNNSLTVILGHCELLLHQVSDNAELTGRLQAIRESVRRSASLTEQLRVLSHQERGEVTTSDASSVILEVLNMLKRILKSDVELQMDIDPELGAVRIGAGQLESVILNLVNNARDAMPNGGRILIEAVPVVLGDKEGRWSVHWFDAVPGAYVKISVIDSGCGMDQQTVGQVFEPFFTTKHVSKGTGLGLSSVFGMVRRAGGGIDLQSSLGQGTRVDVWLPKTEAAEQELAEHPKSGLYDATQKSSILVVDDESAIRALIHAVLEGVGHDVHEASGGDEALAYLNEHPEISVLISDLTMPGMRGEDLIIQARHMKPGLRVLAISGHADHADGHFELNGHRVPSLCKPFGTDELVACVSKVLEQD